MMRVHRQPGEEQAFMELGQEDTVKKVLEIVSSGTVEPGTPSMEVDHMAGGTLFRSIEQGRAELITDSGELGEMEYEIMKNLRE